MTKLTVLVRDDDVADGWSLEGEVMTGSVSKYRGLRVKMKGLNLNASELLLGDRYPVENPLGVERIWDCWLAVDSTVDKGLGRDAVTFVREEWLSEEDTAKDEEAE